MRLPSRCPCESNSKLQNIHIDYKEIYYFIIFPIYQITILVNIYKRNDIISIYIIIVFIFLINPKIE